MKSERNYESMRILSLKIKLYAPWVHSLKEKRMVIKSLMAKLRNKFNISVSEVEEQDTHQTIVIGIAAVVSHNAQAHSVAEEIERYVEQVTEAEMTDIETDIL